MASLSEPDWLTVRLRARRRLAADIHEFVLASTDGAAVPAATAGAHLRLHTPNGMVRCYSLVNAVEEGAHYVIAVKREAAGRGGSVSLIDQATVGDSITVSKPINSFPLRDRPGRVLLIAGGIGITPLLAMARQLSSNGRPFKLIYLTRSPEMTAYADELSTADFSAQVTIHHDGGDPANAFDLWPLLERPGGQLYCCGPRALMSAVGAMTGHWPSNSVHFEDFNGVEAQRPDDMAFTVQLAKSQRTIDVPADASLLAALREAGVSVPSSCESGTCGTCRVGVIDGEPDHRDLALNEEDRRSAMLVCVSRARTPSLVLDL